MVELELRGDGDEKDDGDDGGGGGGRRGGAFGAPESVL